MATYVISDIHGEYEQFIKLIEDEIKLTNSDLLYVLGDVLDRGPHPIKVLLKMMDMPNVIPVAGNHELMALPCLRFLATEITEESVDKIDEYMIQSLLAWQGNGGTSTSDEFHKLSRDDKEKVIEYLEDFSAYEEVTAGDKDYLLVHAGLGNFSPDKDIDEYLIDELVWERADYDEVYFEDIYTVTGHTPTQLIEDNKRPGYIYRANNHIAIDCGACFSGGRLAAICLETGEEFYVSKE